MTKMDMIWIAVATMLYPETGSDFAFNKADIDETVMKMFGVSVTPVMISSHLVNSVDRQVDSETGTRGGSRKRYLAKNSDGRFRLYKLSDSGSDGWDKSGATHPESSKIETRFKHLVDWYVNEYCGS